MYNMNKIYIHISFANYIKLQYNLLLHFLYFHYISTQKAFTNILAFLDNFNIQPYIDIPISQPTYIYSITPALIHIRYFNGNYVRRT